MRAPKILAVASAVDLDFRYGCTPAWWQLWKGMANAGIDLIVTPYRGRPIESPWWRTAPNPLYREAEAFAAARGAVARLKGDRYLRRAEDSPEDTRADRLVRETIWRTVTPRWQRHLERILERERDVDAVVVFTVPMSHLRGIPTALRERFGVPVVFYDGDVPMSLPEFGGMDTGFNYYHGADPSEYDLVLSNSEGGIPRLLELGARRAEALYWAIDPELFAPQPVEPEHDVFFYGYGDKFRREWMRELVGEPSRRLPDASFALGGEDFRGDVGSARVLGPIPYNVFPRAISAARINLNVTRRSHAPFRARRRCARSSSPRARPRSSRTRTRGSSAGSSPAASCWSSTTPTRRPTPTARSSPTRRRRRRWAAVPVSVCSTSTPTRIARAGCSSCSTSASRWWPVPDLAQQPAGAAALPGLAELRRVAIVPALNEEVTVPRVIDELRAFDPGLDIVVVDDGSTDRTAAVAAAQGARVLRLPFNLGIGGAVQTGFRFAFEGGYDLAVRVDGDGQHDPAQLAAVLAPVLRGEVDIAVGSRFAAAGPDGYRSSRSRRVGIRILAAVVSRIVGQRVTDTTSGFQALNRNGDRALRPRLPARLPGGRGDGDGLPPPPAARRGAGDDARARRRPLLDHRAALDLLHGQGAARDLRRPVPPARPPRRGAAVTPLAVSILGSLASFALLVVVFELIRSRRLRERYALLWLATGVVLTVLSAWREGLNTIAGWVGVRSYPPAVLFAVGILFILAVLLHYSTVISRLSDENVVLAQRLALLEQELHEQAERPSR